ncbi:MAG: nitrilase-related carbon-nitrogen hydrolase [Promethearchaeota archaeon]
MRIGYLQTEPIFGDINKNLHHIEGKLRNQHADLIVLPELCTTGYTFTSIDEVKEIAENKSGKTANALMNLAKDIGGAIVAGFAEKSDGKIFNSAMFVTSKGIEKVYRKTHLFNKEKLWFSPGDSGFSVVNFREVNIGMMICFDWIFPESARSLALLGADLIAHPANLVLPYCQKAMTTRCLENHLYAITANRIGTEERGEDNFRFTGQSQITDINGNVLASGSEIEEQLKIIEINLLDARNKQINPYNDLIKDRVPKFYF